MNRYSLNSRILGAGTKVPFSFISAFQDILLIVAAKISVTRVMKVKQSLTLEPSWRIWAYRKFKGAQTFTLTGVNNIHQWVKVYLAGVQNFALSTVAVQKRIIKFVSAIPFDLTASFRMLHYQYGKPLAQFTINGVVNVRTAIRAQLAQALELGPVVKVRTALRVIVSQLLAVLDGIVAFDIPSASAGADRTVVVPWFTRQIIVPSASYSGGRVATMDTQAGTATTPTTPARDTAYDFTGKLDDLRDVESKNAASGQTLVFDGKEWVPTEVDGGTFE